MKGLENYLTLYIISNAVAILLLLAAWRAPKIARVLFFLLFAWAGYTNYYYAIHYPNAYLDYADLSFIRGYKQFILGWFSQHIVVMVGFIATCQALIAISEKLPEHVSPSGRTPRRTPSERCPAAFRRPARSCQSSLPTRSTLPRKLPGYRRSGRAFQKWIASASSAFRPLSCPSLTASATNVFPHHINRLIHDFRGEIESRPKTNSVLTGTEGK